MCWTFVFSLTLITYIKLYQYLFYLYIYISIYIYIYISRQSRHQFSNVGTLCQQSLCCFASVLPTYVEMFLYETLNYAGFCEPFLPINDLWICGMTPPPAIVALIRLSNSSSPRIASCRCLGVIRLTFRSLDAFPANSSTSAVRYSKIAALYTAAVAPTRPWLVVLFFKCLWILPTGNWNQN